MLVSEFRAYPTREPMLGAQANRAEAQYVRDDFDEEFVVSAGTRRMMLVTSAVGAGIWTIILQLIF